MVPQTRPLKLLSKPGAGIRSASQSLALRAEEPAAQHEARNAHAPGSRHGTGRRRLQEKHAGFLAPRILDLLDPHQSEGLRLWINASTPCSQSPCP